MASCNPGFNLCFSLSKIPEWAAKYDERTKSTRDGKDWKREEEIIKTIVPRVKVSHYVQPEDFIKVCTWKSQRPTPHYLENSPKMIEHTTRIALSSRTPDELKIRVMTCLSGVSWPVASVFLHFFDEQRFPILDFRALWSLETSQPTSYDYHFWRQYTECCRDLASKADASMRTLDKALWQYSYEKQP